ncbi:MAG: Asp-tRNA(Asn)/Glu-tRNA(Gln) amidotransferase subunit GatA [Desulfobacteraceae bacterium]|nr:Asp-tRNA(Asn)/Glu-tRNA(Gln) amidotransferase subunit GatA [Desulfobacteraceae bacterium]
MDLQKLTIHELSKKLKNSEITSKEITELYLKRIEKHDKEIGAYITVDREYALKQAQNADKMIAKGNASHLTGVPIAVKDLLCTKGVKTTCGSKILGDFVPEYDATIISLLKDQGAVIIGKTNLDEFAMGSSNENSSFHLTKNPWNKEYVPGGSSGGSAAAVAAGFCVGALGTDTGGSIRQPASHCGVVGLKPTYGRVSRFGLVSYASSLDQIGPITKDVKDAAIILNCIAGKDIKDSTSIDVDVPDYMSVFDEFEKTGLKGMKAGIPKEYLSVEGIDPDVEKVFLESKKRLEDLGVKIVEISLPHTQYVVAAYYIIAPCEASSNLARFDGVRYGHRSKDSDELVDMYKNTKYEGFGEEVKRRIIIGTYALSSGYYDEYYGRASKVRSLIMNDFTKAFNECDIIISPVAPTPAFKIGENIDDPLSMYLSDIFTLSANMASVPGLSVPAGFSLAGLPIGLQMMASRFDEKSLLKAGFAFEKSVFTDSSSGTTDRFCKL